MSQFSRFIQSNDNEDTTIIIPNSPVVDPPAKPPAKRGRKKASETTTVAVTNTSTPQEITTASYLTSNLPYGGIYNETTAQLDETITQLDILGGQIVGELQQVKSSKTLKNKYAYITEMTQAATTILSTKLTAIKEKNHMAEQGHRLELDRYKILKTQANAEDDNTRIANLYDAFINTPVGVGRAGLGPSPQDVVMGGIPGGHIPLTGGMDQIMWEQNLDPASNRMVLEAKGSINTVVVYDEDTGNRWFEVVDKNTGAPVPNVEKPDDTYIYDLDINIRGGFAKDSNRNTTYPLIIVGSNRQ